MSVKWRNVNTTASLLKPIVMNKKGLVESFLTSIGFINEKETLFRYQAPGNINELRTVIEFMKERQTKGSIDILKQSGPAHDVSLDQS